MERVVQIIFSTLSYTKIICTRHRKAKPLSYATQLDFVAHSSLNETKYFFFFTFIGTSFSAAIMLLKIEEGVKIHGVDLHKYVWWVKLQRTLATLFHDYDIVPSVFMKKIKQKYQQKQYLNIFNNWLNWLRKSWRFW